MLFLRHFLILGLTVLASCQQPIAQLPIPKEHLSDDVYFRLDKHTYKLPLRASVDFTGKSSVIAFPDKISGQPINPVAINQLLNSNISHPIQNIAYINFDLNNFNELKDTRSDTWLSTDVQCQKYSQHWARNLCEKNSFDGDKYFFPDGFSFILINKHYLITYKPNLAGFNHPQSVGIQSITLQHYNKHPKTNCSTSPSSLCTAVVEIDKNLLAIWVTTIRSNHDELEKNARLIQALTRYAITEHENYEQFIHELYY
jgi:hypothetical protein